MKIKEYYYNLTILVKVKRKNKIIPRNSFLL